MALSPVANAIYVHAITIISHTDITAILRWIASVTNLKEYLNSWNCYYTQLYECPCMYEALWMNSLYRVVTMQS